MNKIESEMLKEIERYKEIIDNWVKFTNTFEGHTWEYWYDCCENSKSKLEGYRLGKSQEGKEYAEDCLECYKKGKEGGLIEGKKIESSIVGEEMNKVRVQSYKLGLKEGRDENANSFDEGYEDGKEEARKKFSRWTLALFCLLFLVVGILLGLAIGIRGTYVGLGEMASIALKDSNINVQVDLNETELAYQFNKTIVPELKKIAYNNYTKLNNTMIPCQGISFNPKKNQPTGCF